MNCRSGGAQEDDCPSLAFLSLVYCALEFYEAEQVYNNRLEKNAGQGHTWCSGSGHILIVCCRPSDNSHLA
jgi:hypothetical protein